MTRFRPAVLLVAVTALVAAACSKSDRTSKEPRALTQAQRDSAIAASRLPGAGVVGKALEIADSARARADDAREEP